MGGVHKELAGNQASAQEEWRKTPPSSRNPRVRRGGGPHGAPRQRNKQRGGYYGEGSSDTLDQSHHQRISQDDLDEVDSFLMSHQAFGMDSTEAWDKTQLPTILPYVHGNVVKLALSPNPKGSRLLQRVMELIDEKQDLVHLVEQLKGNVISALESPHANHVLQKAIFLLPPCRVDFVALELLSFKDGPSSLARHQFGCRVLERLIEHFPEEKLQQFIDGILKDGKDLCKNQYGNFVVQHLAEHVRSVRKKVVELLLNPAADLQTLALNQHACGVVDAALTYAEQSDQFRLAEQLLRTPDLLLNMCQNKHRGGNEVVKHLFRMRNAGFNELARSSDFNEVARMEFQKGELELQKTKQGKVLLEACMPDQFAKDITKECLAVEH